MHYLINFNRILASGHSLPRKALLSLQWVFMLLNALISWTSVSLLFLTLTSVFWQAVDAVLKERGAL